jgi:hypothetical protein
MSESRLSNWLQTFSAVLAIGAGLVYLFGFVVVSIFDATYGIVDFSIFRPRVIAVGLLFSILLAYPVVVVFRAFAIFGLTSKGMVAPTVSEENRGYLALDIAMSSPLVCVWMAWTVVFLFTSLTGRVSDWAFSLS